MPGQCGSQGSLLSVALPLTMPSYSANILCTWPVPSLERWHSVLLPSPKSIRVRGMSGPSGYLLGQLVVLGSLPGKN